MSKVNELEKRANKTNLKYRKTRQALILKVPTPIILTRKGLIAQQSTVDYTGVMEGGRFLAFDAKETQSKTSFPLANIHQHQLVYLQRVAELGGEVFFLIHFKKLYRDAAFKTPLSAIEKYWHVAGARKSIPISDFTDD